MDLCRPALALLTAVSALLPSVLSAQSPHAFGRPTTHDPNPAAGIAAVPGSRAQG